MLLNEQFSSATLNATYSTKGLQGAQLIQVRELQDTQRKLRQLRQQTEEQFNTLAELIKVFPHPLQAEIQGEHGLAWAALDPAHMVVNVESVTLMHGSAVSGAWRCIALLDAVPTDDSSDADPFGSLGPTPSLRDSMRALQDLIRQNFGRPQFAYGISPIAIYRSVERPQS